MRYLGTPYVHPVAPKLPAINLGWWSNSSVVRKALQINVLFLIGLVLAPLLLWALQSTRWGLIVRTVGESSDAARAMGYSVNGVRMLATMAGGFLAGIGGSFLSLYYPGSWNEGLSSGQGLMAVALVIFARWNPVYCLYAALLFGAAGAGTGAAIGGCDVLSIFFRCDSLCADAGNYGDDFVEEPNAGGCAGGVDGEQIGPTLS